ncbi:hypothetical protein VTJ83DRAFT_4645 [Remersonia thermophila]|uniref:Rhodopsin domain-containing protein n=1 Tax=Remersonia thermophila TaxID=72144 RepID=A0ABR4DAH5_9PEZI
MGLWDVEDYGTVADRACWAMFAVTAVAVGLRLFSRGYYRRITGAGLGWDDYITLFCLIVFLATCILITIGSSYGLGRHMNTLEPAQISLALKYNAIISSVLIWTFSLPKFAIISTLHRILSPGIKTTILFWALGLSSQACILATSIWWFKQCDPVEYGWDRSIEGGWCAPVSVLANLGYFTSAYSAFLDLFFSLYPIPFIMRLNMPLKERIAVAVAMGLSSSACFLSIYKLAIFGEIFEILAVDPTYPVPYLDILGLAEGTILLVCISLPTLGPLFRAVTGKLHPSSNNSYQLSGATPHGSGSQRRRSLFGGAAGGSKALAGGGWDKVKGHKLDSDAEGASLHLRPSFDNTPLVTSAKVNNPTVSNGNADLERSGLTIHKTTEVSVSSQPFSVEVKR